MVAAIVGTAIPILYMFSIIWFADWIFDERQFYHQLVIPCGPLVALGAYVLTFLWARQSIPLQFRTNRKSSKSIIWIRLSFDAFLFVLASAMAFHFGGGWLFMLGTTSVVVAFIELLRVCAEVMFEVFRAPKLIRLALFASRRG